jgi:hypothetical protein
MAAIATANFGWAIREEQADAARLELGTRELGGSTPVLNVTTCP